MASIAEQLNYVAGAINDRRIEMQRQKAAAAIAAGMGMVQDRGRGSMAGMQSGFYSQMAAIWNDPNMLPDQQDFSYWIMRDREEEADEIREKENRENELNGGGGGGGAGGGGGGGSSRSGAPIVGRPTYGDPNSTTFGPEGKGDIVTTGPHAGQRPVYTYDPINKTTTVSWEDA
jgi:hypothetical protein